MDQFTLVFPLTDPSTSRVFCFCFHLIYSPPPIPYLRDLFFSFFFFSFFSTFTISTQLIIFISPLSFFSLFLYLRFIFFNFFSSTVNPLSLSLSLSLKCPSKHQSCTYLYAQSAILLCCNDTTSLPFFSV